MYIDMKKKKKRRKTDFSLYYFAHGLIKYVTLRGNNCTTTTTAAMAVDIYFSFSCEYFNDMMKNVCVHVYQRVLPYASAF